MSSVDLHTHFPFQLLMPEAIAIVCAPTQSPNYGIFRLTDPPGLNIISKCLHPSAFHRHEEAEEHRIYSAISGPKSHAQFSDSIQLQIFDFRGNK